MDSIFVRQQEKICSYCGQAGGNHKPSCPKIIAQDIESFVFDNAPHVEEKKMKELIKGNLSKWSQMPMEMRLKALEEMRRRRREKILLSTNPLKEKRAKNEIALIDEINKAFHPGGEIEIDE